MYTARTKEQFPERIFAVIPARYPAMMSRMKNGLIPFAVRER